MKDIVELPSKEQGRLKGRIEKMTVPTNFGDWNLIGYRYENLWFDVDRNPSNVSVVHLYQLSWDFLVPGCWVVVEGKYIGRVHNLWKLNTGRSVVDIWVDGLLNTVFHTDCRRIVSTTDPSVGLPLLSEEFQQNYCDFKGGSRSAEYYDGNCPKCGTKNTIEMKWPERWCNICDTVWCTYDGKILQTHRYNKKIYPTPAQ